MSQDSKTETSDNPAPKPEEAAAGNAPSKDETAARTEGGGTAMQRFLIPGLGAAGAGLLGAALVLLVQFLTGPTGGDAAGDVAALRADLEKAGVIGGRQSLAEKLDALEAEVDDLAKLSMGTPLSDRINSLSDSLIALRSQLSAITGAEPGTVISFVEGDMGERLDRLRGELARLDTRLGQMAEESASGDAEIAGRVQTLETTVPDDLGTQLDRAAQKTTVNAMEARVAQLERDAVGRETRRAAMALALANLLRAAGASAPFEAELSALNAFDLAGADTAALEPFAATGLPTEQSLISRFDGVAAQIVRAHAKGQGWMPWFHSKLTGAFTLRPTGEVEGREPPAIAARAERRLADGDMAAAVAELAALEGETAKAAAPWLAQAKARLELGRLVSQLNGRVLEEIAAFEGTAANKTE